MFNLFKRKNQLQRSAEAVKSINKELERLHNTVILLLKETNVNVINSRTLAEKQIKELQIELVNIAKMKPCICDFRDE